MANTVLNSPDGLNAACAIVSEMLGRSRLPEMLSPPLGSMQNDRSCGSCPGRQTLMPEQSADPIRRTTNSNAKLAYLALLLISRAKSSVPSNLPLSVNSTFALLTSGAEILPCFKASAGHVLAGWIGNPS